MAEAFKARVSGHCGDDPIYVIEGPQGSYSKFRGSYTMWVKARNARGPNRLRHISAKSVHLRAKIDLAIKELNNV